MKRKVEAVSAIILAGGMSSRMGVCKAELKWNGKSLIEHQIDKMRGLGIEDIIISGYPNPIERTRFVPDAFPQKGPLGGIHAGLLAAKHSHCLVTSVDTPLVPAQSLSELIQFHLAGSCNISILTHGDKLEPLMGVYDRWLYVIAAEILRTDNTSVRQLLNRVSFARFGYEGDENLLCDCNTPEEFEKAIQTIKSLT